MPHEAGNKILSGNPVFCEEDKNVEENGLLALPLPPFCKAIALQFYRVY